MMNNSNTNRFGRRIGFGGVMVFAVVALALFGVAGCDSGGCSDDDGHGHGKPAKKNTSSSCSDDDGHDHGKPPAKKAEPASGCSDGDGHDHSRHGPGDGHGHGQFVNRDPAEIEAMECEHDIRTIDCDECRYELGVVKVDPSVTAALTKTTLVREGSPGRTLRLTGEVQYDQTTVVDVLPAAAGKVVSVKVRLGQKVQAGDVLAVIHSGEFGEAKAAYLEAHASAEVAEQEKRRQVEISASLEKLLAASKEGPVTEMNGEVLGEWKSKLVNAVSRLKQATVVLEREKNLVAKQASSQAELEAAEREMETAQADYAALLEEIQINNKLDRLKAESGARLADAKLTAAAHRLHLFGLDDATIEAIPLMKENGGFAQLVVKAPRTGVVTAQDVTEGKFVENSQILYTIADTSNVWVWADLYERDLEPLHDRMAKGETPRAGVKVTAFADVFPGVVDLVGSTVDETTRTVKVRVQVNNNSGKLRPGMFAAVEIPLAESGKVAMVPRHAVLSDEGQTFAFVHWKDDLWLRRDVSVGRPQGEMMEIHDGLSIGDRVVASGGFMFKSDVLRAKMGAGCAD